MHPSNGRHPALFLYTHDLGGPTPPSTPPSTPQPDPQFITTTHPPPTCLPIQLFTYLPTQPLTIATCPAASFQPCAEDRGAVSRQSAACWQPHQGPQTPLRCCKRWPLPRQPCTSPPPSRPHQGAHASVTELCQQRCSCPVLCQQRCSCCPISWHRCCSTWCPVSLHRCDCPAAPPQSCKGSAEYRHGRSCSSAPLQRCNTPPAPPHCWGSSPCKPHCWKPCDPALHPLQRGPVPTRRRKGPPLCPHYHPFTCSEYDRPAPSGAVPHPALFSGAAPGRRQA